MLFKFPVWTFQPQNFLNLLLFTDVKMLLLNKSVYGKNLFKAWFSTCNKELLSFILCRCPSQAIYTDLFTLSYSKPCFTKKANAKLISEAWSIFAISNETIERSNKMIWYFHFFWNSNRKEITRPWEKAKKEKLKAKTNRRRKWIREIKVITGGSRGGPGRLVPPPKKK